MKELSEKLLSLVEVAEPRLAKLVRGEAFSRYCGAAGRASKSSGTSLIRPQITINDSFELFFKHPWISLVTTRAEACECKLFKALIGNSGSCNSPVASPVASLQIKNCMPHRFERCSHP